MGNGLNKNSSLPILNGLKLGMLLQVGGMGPICFLLFQLASILPLSDVLIGVCAVAFADAIYITISVLGIMGIIKQVKGFSRVFKSISGVIIVMLGISFCMMIFSESAIDTLFPYDWKTKNVFAGLFVLTMLNPVTIVCFSGVLTAKLVDTNMNNKQLSLFALGTLISTPIFLSFVVLLGAFGSSFLPEILVRALNFVVGILLIYWGFKYIFPDFGKPKAK